MLGVNADLIEDETISPNNAARTQQPPAHTAKSTSSSSKLNVSASTVSAAAQNKIEEEIIAEEIRLASKNAQLSAQKKNFQRRRSSDLGADMIEDFDNDYLEETFKDDENQKTEEDAIVDEVEEEDALRMIDEEIMNTAIAKQDAKKLKDLIGKIDGVVPRSSSGLDTSDGRNVNGEREINSGSFKLGSSNSSSSTSNN